MVCVVLAEAVPGAVASLAVVLGEAAILAVVPGEVVAPVAVEEREEAILAPVGVAAEAAAILTLAEALAEVMVSGEAEVPAAPEALEEATALEEAEVAAKAGSQVVRRRRPARSEPLHRPPHAEHWSHGCDWRALHCQSPRRRPTKPQTPA